MLDGYEIREPVWRTNNGVSSCLLLLGGNDFPRFRSYLLEPDLCFFMYTECIDMSSACVTNLSKLIAWRRRQCESLSTALPKIVLAPTRIYDFHLHIAKQEMGHGSFPTTPHHCILQIPSVRKGASFVPIRCIQYFLLTKYAIAIVSKKIY